MPTRKQVKHALHHHKEFNQIIPDIATFRSAMEHTDLRVRLFQKLLKHPKNLDGLVTNCKDFHDLIQIDWDYLLTPECNHTTAQELLLEQLVKNSDFLNKVIKNNDDLSTIADIIQLAPITEEKKSALRLQIIEKLVAIKDKYLAVFHAYGGYSDLCLAKERHDWPEAIALLSKMELEQVFSIFFEQFRNNNFENLDSFNGTLEDMRTRWKTFDKAAYEFCVTQLQAILKLPTMKEPMYRDYLVSYLEDCERSRPKDVASLLDVELQYKMKIDPGFERYPPGVFEAFLASQQKKGLLQPMSTPVVTMVSTTREPSPKPTGLPMTVKSS